MTTALSSTHNPFSQRDTNRREIWDMLMQRDFEAFVAADWSIVENDFWREGFCGIDARGSSDPDQWRINYPDVETYRDEWLRQARDFAVTELVDTTPLDFLFEACRLQEIEISGNHAAAHKKFSGTAITAEGAEIALHFQTFYTLVRRSNRWMISGFVGYMPNLTREMAPSPTPTS
jgi:hypothetical protein